MLSLLWGAVRIAEGGVVLAGWAGGTGTYALHVFSTPPLSRGVHCV
jgi:hypothetical protein